MKHENILIASGTITGIFSLFYLFLDYGVYATGLFISLMAIFTVCFIIGSELTLMIKSILSRYAETYLKEANGGFQWKKKMMIILIILKNI